MAFSAVNDSARALEGILARWSKDIDGSLVSGGSSNAYTLASNRTLSSYAQNQFFIFEANHANTGAATLNVDSIGAKSIKKHNDVDLASGDIESGQIVAVVYEAAADAFQMISQLGNAGLQSSDIGTSVLAPDGDGSGLSGVELPGSQTIVIPAASFTPRTTNGPAAATTELATNDVMLSVLDFDASTDEGAQFMIPMPKSWNAGTITAQFFWTAASGSGDVVWAIRALSLANDDALDSAFGTAVTVTDTLTATGDLCITSATSAVTPSNTAAKEDLVVIEVYRDADNGSDTLSADARLIAVRIIYTTDAANDA
jgi:hypothetical protein